MLATHTWVFVISARMGRVVKTYEPAAFPRDERELINARATALLEEGRDMVPLAQARKHMKPEYDCAIKKLPRISMPAMPELYEEPYSDR